MHLTNNNTVPTNTQNINSNNLNQKQPTTTIPNGKLLNGNVSATNEINSKTILNTSNPATIIGNNKQSSSSMDHSTIINNNVVTPATPTMVTGTPSSNPSTPNKRLLERENLKNIIAQWNANRLDLFEISEPNEDLEFYGVMRFYFQDAGQKVATKCMRISSTASTKDVISNLIEKFRPDIRMLSVPEYALYEIHENGEERKLADVEFPLLVQLNWHKDDREGRFLLRRMDEKTYLPGFTSESGNIFNRKLSKRELKEKKKKEKKEKASSNSSGNGGLGNIGIGNKKDSSKGSTGTGKDSLAEKLYTELPETSFTRSISNPEAVMRRRRQQKLEKKLQQFSQEGGADAGGTLRIFGESINQDVPYKTILLSTRDTAMFAVKEILEKYGKDKEDPAQYCLVQVIVPFVNGDASATTNGNVSTSSDSSQQQQQQSANTAVSTATTTNNNSGIREFILDDDDCPLIIERSHNKSRGVLTFHIKRRPPDYQPRRRKKKQIGVLNDTAQPLPSSSSLVNAPSSSLNPSYETTFDADGKIETSSSVSATGTTIIKPDAGNLHGPSMLPPQSSSSASMMFNTGSLQRHQTMGSLAQRASTSTLGSQMPANTLMDANNMSRVGSGHQTIPNYHNNNANQMIRKGDNILPAILEVGEDVEDLFLTTIIKRINPNQVQFKLCITYSLYMVTRYRASTYFKPEITPEIRAELLVLFCIKYAKMIQQAINENHADQSALAFWLANSSEILHFLKNDRHLSAFTYDSQDILAEAVQMAFNFLVKCHQNELQDALSTFTTDIVDPNPNSMDKMTQNILKVLSNSMQLLRRFRVNAALTIQLFSQLFHFINMWLFNKVIGTPESNYCSLMYGIKLKQCLGQIELWAEKQGLELAAECHLARIKQTAMFLQGAKKSPDDLNALVANFYKLNSIQLRALCERYQPMADEILFTTENIQNMVRIARSTTDELIINDGREIRLEEEIDLQLPFLLPEDGYSCDIVRGIPTGLQDFVQTLVQAGVCSLTIQPTASGYWTIYFINFQADQPPHLMIPQQPPPGAMYQEFNNQIKSSTLMQRGSITSDKNSISSAHHFAVPSSSSSINNHQMSLHSLPKALTQTMNKQGFSAAAAAYGTVRMMPEPEIQVIKLQKINNGIGLSIVAARGTNQTQLGIYIKSVVKGGAADADGRLEAGDQLLKVDGQSLIGITQEKAAELMTQTGPVVTLEVAKQGALYHGLGGILSPHHQASSATSSLSSIASKNMTLRPRFIPNAVAAATDYGQTIHHSRFNSQYNQMFSMQQQQARMPGYNSLPLSLNYPYRNHQMGNTINAGGVVQQMPMNYAGGSIPNSNSVNNMRPESQSSYSSQTNNNHASNNIMNSPLVNSNSSGRHFSTASLPSVNHSVGAPASHMFAEERHYQNIQLYHVEPNLIHNNNSNTNKPSISSLTKLSPSTQPHLNLIPASSSATTAGGTIASRTLLSGSHSSLPQSSQQQQPSSISSLLSEQQQQSLTRPVSAVVTGREQDQIFQQNGPFLSSNNSNTMKRTDFSQYSQQPSANSSNSQMMLPRSRLSASQQQQPTSLNGFRSSYNGGPVGSNSMMRNSSSGVAGGPPPPAPKPMRSMQALNSSSSQENMMNPAYQQPPPAMNYRYGPSGYPPSQQQQQSKSNINNNNSNNSGVSSPSPWEREEKEREFKQRIEETKRSRDEEIKHLESLPYRNSKHEERLNKLKFERDFQKRAEEDEDEDEQEVLERAEQLERKLTIQQGLERIGQRRLEQQQQQQYSNNADSSRLVSNITKMDSPKEDESSPQEVNNKKRQDEESKVLLGKGILKSNNNTNNNNSNMILENNSEQPPALPKSSPPIESPNQRLDRLILSTNTTTDKSPKKVSWNDSPALHDGNAEEEDEEEEDEDDEEEQEEGEVEEGEGEEPQEDRFSLQDIDDVLGSQGPNGKDWLNNYVSGSTPGVIGAQEVYNDPRKRIEAERFKSNQQQTSTDKLPEKLSFQEKMKMFAKTTAANMDETPVRSNKVKISKAQREIEDRDNNFIDYNNQL